ncbi:hypothetical protein PV325_003370, partial [Microctonus aethiopoides]
MDMTEDCWDHVELLRDVSSLEEPTAPQINTTEFLCHQQQNQHHHHHHHQQQQTRG